MQRFYPTSVILYHTAYMTREIFEPPEVPLNSRALVAILKRRLHEAIETGKASDAKIFVDIIERLAKMAWLDDTPTAEKEEAERLRKARVMADVNIRIAQLLKEQDVQEAQQASAAQEFSTIAQIGLADHGEYAKQTLPVGGKINSPAPLETKRAYINSIFPQPSPFARVTEPRDEWLTRALQHVADLRKTVTLNLREDLRSGVRLPP